MAPRRNKATIAPTTTSPAKMGEEMAYPAPNNSESPNVQYAPRKSGKSDAPVGVKANRTGKLERLGAQFAPQMPLYTQNAAAASEVQKNVRRVPSAIGNRDFYLKRQYGQTGDFG